MDMKATTRLYKLLNNDQVSRAEKTKDLDNYIQQALALSRSPNADLTKIAYGIAGLMSTTYARELGDDEPRTRLLEMAGELELPVQVRPKSATWDTWRQLAASLPDRSM